MSSDEERREVARRLRNLDGERIAGKIALNRTWVFADVLDEALSGKRIFKIQKHDFGYITSKLADLIEPEPERTARLEYDEIHDCNVCTGCGERYEYDKYIALTDDYLIAFKPMRFCPNCGVRFKEDDDGNE